MWSWRTNVRPALEQSCGKQMLWANIHFPIWIQVCYMFSILKCRGESHLVLSRCTLAESGPWEWGLLYRGPTVGQDLSIYRGVAKPYRGLLYQFGRWLNSFCLLFNQLLPFPQLSPTLELTTPRRDKEFCQRPAWYKGPRYGLATHLYITRSCPTLGPRYNKPHHDSDSRGPGLWSFPAADLQKEAISQSWLPTNFKVCNY